MSLLAAVLVGALAAFLAAPVAVLADAAGAAPGVRRAIAGWGHCCIESEAVGEGQRSGGSPYGEGAKNDLNHAIVTAMCRVERPSGGSRKG
jgi:hypothetical protein